MMIGMRVVQCDGRRYVVRIFEFPYTQLEPSYCLLENLCPRLALAIIIFTAICLLSAHTLLTRWFRAITSLDAK